MLGQLRLQQAITFRYITCDTQAFGVGNLPGLLAAVVSPVSA